MAQLRHVELRTAGEPHQTSLIDAQDSAPSRPGAAQHQGEEGVAACAESDEDRNSDAMEVDQEGEAVSSQKEGSVGVAPIVGESGGDCDAIMVGHDRVGGLVARRTQIRGIEEHNAEMVAGKDVYHTCDVGNPKEECLWAVAAPASEGAKDRDAKMVGREGAETPRRGSSPSGVGVVIQAEIDSQKGESIAAYDEAIFELAGDLEEGVAEKSAGRPVFSGSGSVAAESLAREASEGGGVTSPNSVIDENVEAAGGAAGPWGDTDGDLEGVEEEKFACANAFLGAEWTEEASGKVSQVGTEVATLSVLLKKLRMEVALESCWAPYERNPKGRKQKSFPECETKLSEGVESLLRDIQGPLSPESAIVFVERVATLSSLLRSAQNDLKSAINRVETRVNALKKKARVGGHPSAADPRNIEVFACPIMIHSSLDECEVMIADRAATDEGWQPRHLHFFCAALHLTFYA